MPKPGPLEPFAKFEKDKNPTLDDDKRQKRKVSSFQGEHDTDRKNKWKPPELKWHYVGTFCPKWWNGEDRDVGIAYHSNLNDVIRHCTTVVKATIGTPYEDHNRNWFAKCKEWYLANNHLWYKDSVEEDLGIEHKVCPCKPDGMVDRTTIANKIARDAEKKLAKGSSPQPRSSRPYKPRVMKRALASSTSLPSESEDEEDRHRMAENATRRGLKSISTQRLPSKMKNVSDDEEKDETPIVSEDEDIEIDETPEDDDDGNDMVQEEYDYDIPSPPPESEPDEGEDDIPSPPPESDEDDIPSPPPESEPDEDDDE